MTKSEFDATSSLLGYIYQVRLALLLALTKVTENEDPDIHFVSIEKLDDIAFETSSNPKELLQTKYHGTPGNISNKSPDIWKTFRIWAENILNDQELFLRTTFFLITTETAVKDTLAFYLSSDESKRDTTKAASIIRSFLLEKPSTENEKGHSAVHKLSATQLFSFLSRIYIHDNSQSITDIETSIRNKVRLSFDKQYLSPSLERLEGFWFKRVIDCLTDNNSSDKKISIGELVYKMEDIRSQINPHNLPNDYSGAELDEDFENLVGDVFIKQLELFVKKPFGPINILKIATENYYRAYAQVNKWSADGLLRPGEIKKFNEKVQSEWEHHYSLNSYNFDFSIESQKLLFAHCLYSKCQSESILSIRSEFKDSYITRGTYHYLANKMKLGWHPEYFMLLNASNDGAAA